MLPNSFNSKQKKPSIKNTGIKDVEFGINVTIVEPVNLYGCSIGTNSFIGPFTEIQKGVQVGNDCRIQSHSFICELVTIGNNCFIGHGVMFINDLMKNGSPAGDKTKWKATNKYWPSCFHWFKCHNSSCRYL